MVFLYFGDKIRNVQIFYITLYLSDTYLEECRYMTVTLGSSVGVFHKEAEDTSVSVHNSIWMRILSTRNCIKVRNTLGERQPPKIFICILLTSDAINFKHSLTFVHLVFFRVKNMAVSKLCCCRRIETDFNFLFRNCVWLDVLSANFIYSKLLWRRRLKLHRYLSLV